MLQWVRAPKFGRSREVVACERGRSSEGLLYLLMGCLDMQVAPLLLPIFGGYMIENA